MQERPDRADTNHRATITRWVSMVSFVLLAVALASCSGTLSQAGKAMESGDLAAAAKLYQQCVAAHPDDVSATKALAAVLYVQRRWDEALPVQEKAVEMDPGEAQIRVELGFNYLNHQEQAGKAVQVFEEACRLQPTAQYLSFLGSAQLSAGEEESAEASLRRALVTDSSYPHAYVVLISLLERQGRAGEVDELRRIAAASGLTLDLNNTTPSTS